jgi:hypothetical protein
MYLMSGIIRETIQSRHILQELTERTAMHFKVCQGRRKRKEEEGEGRREERRKG